MFCKSIQPKVKSLLRQFDVYVEEHLEVALQVATALKKALDSPVADLATALIPGDTDVLIRATLLKALGKVVEVLLIADSCKLYTSLNDKLQCFAQQLSRRDPELRDAVLLKFASLLTGELDCNRFKQNVYDLFTQAKYSVTK